VARDALHRVLDGRTRALHAGLPLRDGVGRSGDAEMPSLYKDGVVSVRRACAA